MKAEREKFIFPGKPAIIMSSFFISDATLIKQEANAKCISSPAKEGILSSQPPPAHVVRHIL